MMEPDTETLVTFPRDFPLEDVEQIAKFLENAGALVPGYVPPEVGFLDVAAFVYAEHVDEQQTMILLDRNLASRMARVARTGPHEIQDEPSLLATRLMAFAQSMNLQFDPAVAFHELAHKEGNAIANDELAWFRAADQGQHARIWIDLAMQRQVQFKIEPPVKMPTYDLAFPLKRWQRNYIIALQIARLELEDWTPVERATTLLDWMLDEFLIAGPAASFSLMYFAPNSSKKRLIKRLRSTQRDRAIEGVANAAWDITYLSNFVESVARGNRENIRYIFATADRSLAKIAPLLFASDPDTGFEGDFGEALCDWWPSEQARILGARISKLIELTQNANRMALMRARKLEISDLIAHGEQRVRSWKPK